MTTAPLGMTLAELDRADASWPNLGSPWDRPLPLRDDLELGEAIADLDRRTAARGAAKQWLLGLRGRARYVARGWDIEKDIFIGDAEMGIGGCWLCHKAQGQLGASWTRDLGDFDPLDDAAHEVLAFVALQIERDHHLGDRARAPESAMPPPRDAHLRHLRGWIERRSRGGIAPAQTW